MSVYAVSYYNREGYLPGLSRAPLNSQMIDPDKDAFSTAPHDDYAPVHNADEHEIPEYPGRPVWVSRGITSLSRATAAKALCLRKRKRLDTPGTAGRNKISEGGSNSLRQDMITSEDNLVRGEE
jgi:hypothetical protein